MRINYGSDGGGRGRGRDRGKGLGRNASLVLADFFSFRKFIAMNILFTELHLVWTPVLPRILIFMFM